MRRVIRSLLLSGLFLHVITLKLWTQAPAANAPSRPDIIVEDFEGANYGAWKVTGTAFGDAPAHGALPNQMALDGFMGHGFASSFHEGDRSTGTLTSVPYIVERQYIEFLIGGGGYSGKTCINLLSDGKVVRTATGPNTQPGGSEHLDWQGWDVGELAGKKVALEIVDMATGGWGHISIDQIVQSDKKIGGLILNNALLPLKAEKHYLNLPVKNGAPKRTLRLLADGQAEREFEIELANDKPDWWAFMDLTAFKGKALMLQADRLPENCEGWKQICESDVVQDAEDTYRERLRPQLHFSSRRGWNNDPNGLVFCRGKYHLFYQHNPYGWGWGNMHWGHAISRDLVHWTESAEALYPDSTGMMYSGSAVMDWKNTSGFGKNAQTPMVLIYTSAGDRFEQSLAYSLDGGQTFTKYERNPVVKQITGGNRDPKVFWHEPTKKWVMVLWVELDHQNTIHFLTSPNLKDWTTASKVGGFFECPDMFELPVDGNKKTKKWVLTAASSEYQVGSFDGQTFTAESDKLPGQQGRGFYAAQTYSDIPGNNARRIQIGWMRAPSPGMPFNQCMSLPLELKLISTLEGTRLTWQPVAELAKLRKKRYELKPLTLNPGETKALKANGDLLELRAEFEPRDNSRITFKVRGIPVTYDSAKQQLIVAEHRTPAPLRDGKQRLILYTDRTTFEIFASDGLTYVPLPLIPDPNALQIEMSASGGAVKFTKLGTYELQSIWR